MLVTLVNVKELDLNKYIGVISNKFVDDEKYFIVNKEIDIQLSCGSIITIDKGFNFNGSSSPRLLRGIFPAYGPFLFAAMIHDWMYEFDYVRSISGVKVAKKLADKEQLMWSNVLNDRTLWSLTDNIIRYAMVRVFGTKSYIR